MARRGARAVAVLTVLALLPSTVVLSASPPASKAAAHGKPSAKPVARKPAPPPRPVVPPEIALMRSGLDFAARGDTAAAMGVADQVGNPIYTKLVRWVDLTRGSAEGGYFEGLAFVAENPRWPRLDTLRKRIERLTPDGLAPDQVTGYFDAQPPLTGTGVDRYASALLLSNKRARAEELIRRTWRDGQLQPGEDDLFRDRWAAVLTRADDIARLDHLLWARQWDPARRLAFRIGPDYQQLAEARWALATNNPGAEAVADQVPRELQHDAGLFFDRADWRRKRGAYSDIVEMLDGRDASQVKPDTWWPVRNWVVRRALEEGDNSVAYRVAAQHGMEKGSNFAEGEWLAGWVALRFLNNAKGAAAHFGRLYQNVATPVSKARGAYWAGRAAAASGQATVARQWYARAAEEPTTFYGQLAGAELGTPVPVRAQAPAPATPQMRAEFDRDDLVQAIRLLNRIGDRERAGIFLVHLSRLVPDPATARQVADLALDQGRPDLSLKIARGLWSRGIVLPDHLYPTRPVGGADNLDNALVLALIRQESDFNADAVSKVGARGLMQLMPGTAQAMARKVGVSYVPQQLNNPEFNMRLGRAYLGQQIERFDGSLIMAVAAYNAGPGSVSRWVNALGDPRLPTTDTVDWIESIPFSETRNYVQRVLEGMQVYRQRLQPGSQTAMLVSPDIRVTARATPRPQLSATARNELLAPTEATDPGSAAPAQAREEAPAPVAAAAPGAVDRQRCLATFDTEKGRAAPC